MKLSKLTKPELEKILKDANFTEDEEKVFKQMSKGETIQSIAFSIGASDRTVNRRIADVREKIKRLERENNGNNNNGRKTD